MDNFRKSLIEELMLTLKIPQGNFNFGTIADEIESIPNSSLKEFYKLVMTSDTYGNGMKAIISIAETFKPKDNDLEIRAKKLIMFTETQHRNISNLAISRGEDFIGLVKSLKPSEKYKKSFDVMSLVKPYYDSQELVINIMHYQTANDALNAFKQAIIAYDSKSEQLSISNNVTKLLKAKK